MTLLAVEPKCECDTSRGSADASNEMVGLVRSFLCAGASTVVATHWPIRDASASGFMRTLTLPYCG